MTLDVVAPGDVVSDLNVKRGPATSLQRPGPWPQEV
jgi:hypothetical protein